MRKLRSLFGPKEAYLAALLVLGYLTLHGSGQALVAFVATSTLCIVRA